MSSKAIVAKKIVKLSCYRASKIKRINPFKRVSFKKILNALEIDNLTIFI